MTVVASGLAPPTIAACRRGGARNVQACQKSIGQGIGRARCIGASSCHGKAISNRCLRS